MTIKSKLIYIDSVCSIMALLFAYVAVSKLLDHNNFTAVIHLTIRTFIPDRVIAYCIPITELLIAIMLSIHNFRKPGLYAFLFMMFAFSAYIILMLNSGKAIPCNCGGIISAMSWKGHLLFNTACIILTIAAIIIDKKVLANLQSRPKKILK